MSKRSRLVLAPRKSGDKGPARPRSYADILQLAVDADIRRLSEEATDELGASSPPSARSGTLGLPPTSMSSRGRLRSIYSRDPDVLASIGAALRKLNDKGGRAALEAVLDHQFYRLTYWRDATTEVNYRRFLTLNDYVAIRTEEMPVFHESHDFLIDLVSKGVVAGLRVDHPDGLADPTRALPSTCQRGHPVQRRRLSREERGRARIHRR